MELLLNVVIFETLTYICGKTASSEEHLKTLSSLGNYSVKNEKAYFCLLVILMHFQLSICNVASLGKSS